MCKTILKEKQIALKSDEDLPKLVYLTIEQLEPMKNAESMETEKVLKRTVGSLLTLAQSIAELRNVHGTGHGKEAGTNVLCPRQAALAVNSALALAYFLYQSYQDR